MSSPVEEPLKASGVEKSSLRPYAAGLAFGFFNGVNWMICLGTPMVLISGQLGASTVQVGAAYAAVFLTLPIQILATAWLPKYGYKRQMMFAWRSRSFSLLIPLGLALSAPEQPAPWMAHLMIFSVYLFCLLRSVGSCCYMPWMYALLPEKIQGRYFATDQFLSGFAGVFTLLCCAWLLRTYPVWKAFSMIYTLAIAGAVLSNYFLSLLPEVAKPARTSLRKVIEETPRLCLRKGIFRQYLVLSLLQALAWSSFMPFTAYYLQFEAALPAEKILVITSVQYLGGIAGAWFIRRQVDRGGARPVFVLALGLTVFTTLFWIAFIVWLPVLQYFIMLSAAMAGMGAALWTTAHLKYMPQVCPPGQQALATSVQSAVVGVLGGLAPMVIGYLVKERNGQPGIDEANFALYLAIAATLQALLVVFFWRLPESRTTKPTLLAAPFLFRPFRYFVSWINLTEKEEKDS